MARILSGERASEFDAKDTCGADGVLVSELHVVDLQRKVENLERAMETQRTIGIAVGLLAERAGCRTDEAWDLLRHVSQDSNRKVRDVARILHDAVDGRLNDGDAETLAAIGPLLPCVHRAGRSGALDEP